MALLLHFPQKLLSEHSTWHMAHMNEKAKGEGVKFLEFHRHFIAEFHAWYDSSPGANLGLVAPWASLPPQVIANLKPATASKLAAIAADPAKYQTDDKLGIAIHPLHDEVHGAIAAAFGEPEMNDPSTAPKYSEFWKLHGLIDHWFTVWQQAHPGK